MHTLQRTCLVLGLLSLGGLPAIADTPQKKPATTHAKPAQKPTPKPPEKKPEPKPEQKPEKKPEAPKKAGIGDEVDGAISLNDTDGKAHALKDYRGKTLVVAMWSIDCPACKQYQDRLKKLNDDYASKGVVVIAVDPNAGELDPGADPYKRIKEYAGKNPLGAALLADSGDKLTEKLGATMTPEVFVIDAKGVLRYKGAIDDDPKGEKADKANAYVRKALDELIGGKPVTTSTTPVNGAPITRGPAPKPAEPPKKPDDKPAPPKKG